jgi:hypothetical protein
MPSLNKNYVTKTLATLSKGSLDMIVAAVISFSRNRKANA